MNFFEFCCGSDNGRTSSTSQEADTRLYSDDTSNFSNEGYDEHFLTASNNFKEHLKEQGAYSIYENILAEEEAKWISEQEYHKNGKAIKKSKIVKTTEEYEHNDIHNKKQNAQLQLLSLGNTNETKSVDYELQNNKYHYGQQQEQENIDKDFSISSKIIETNKNNNVSYINNDIENKNQKQYNYYNNSINHEDKNVSYTNNNTEYNSQQQQYNCHENSIKHYSLNQQNPIKMDLESEFGNFLYESDDDEQRQESKSMNELNMSGTDYNIAGLEACAKQNYSQSKVIFKLAMRQAIFEKDEILLARASSNLANIYETLKRSAKALVLYKQAISLLESNGQYHLEKFIISNALYPAVRLKRYQYAITLIQREIEILQKEKTENPNDADVDKQLEDAMHVSVTIENAVKEGYELCLDADRELYCVKDKNHPIIG